MAYSLSAVFLSRSEQEAFNHQGVSRHIASCGLHLLHLAEVEEMAEGRKCAEEYLIHIRPGAEWTHVAFCLDQNPPPAGEVGLDLENERTQRVAGMGLTEGMATDSWRSPIVAKSVVGWARGTREAWAVARAVCPEHYSEMRDSVLSTMDALRPPFPVVKDLTTRGVHAKVYLVRYKERPAICKVFRWNSRLFCERIGLSLHDRVEGVPRLLLSQENWVLMEYLDGYEEARTGLMSFLPLRPIRKAFEYLHLLHEAGYSLLDFHPGNVMVKGSDARIIDLEHLYKYPGKAPPFEKSPAIVGSAYFDERGPAEEWEGAGRRVAEDTWYPTYEERWKPYLGVDLHTLLHGSMVRIIWERTRYLMFTKLPSRVRRFASMRRHSKGR